MFDALADIGGTSAINALVEALQTTTSPREIATLTQRPDALAPEQRRSLALEAARQSLALSAERKLERYDVGPLFEVLERYGAEGVVTDL